jgi:TPR repeat protein
MDHVEAVAWYHKAAEQGQRRAADALRGTVTQLGEGDGAR